MINLEMPNLVRQHPLRELCVASSYKYALRTYQVTDAKGFT